MPRDKTENHEKIIESAFAEFLEYGFKDVSMRRIAEACGMSASGLYKHFPSKGVICLRHWSSLLSKASLYCKVN